MPDIVLVQPPNPVLSDPTTRWPLGLAYLEAVLKQLGADVAVVDLRAAKGVCLELIPEAPIVGFTATTGEFGSVQGLARELKARNSRTRVVLGGPHATHLTAGCLDGSFDSVVVGEGEPHCKALLDGVLSRMTTSRTVAVLDSLPFPVRHPFSFSTTLIKGAGYGEGPKATSLVSSRGCPFLCAFCQSQPRVVRYRSPANVVEEIQQIQRDWDCHHFRFEDDTFTLKRDRVFELCRRLEPLKVVWRCHTRSDVFTPALAQAMKRAGCAEVGFGVESADQGVLDTIDKRETVGEHIMAIQAAKAAGLETKAFFMTGLPGEQDNIVELTRQFLEKAQPSKVILSRFTPYPGSAIWAHPTRYGVDWRDPDFAHYWNFPEHTTVTYHDASAEVLDARYHKLYRLLWSDEWRKP